MTKSKPAKNLVTLAVAAEHLGVCTHTVRRFISRGKLTGYRLGTRAIRVDMNEVEELLRPMATAGSR